MGVCMCNNCPNKDPSDFKFLEYNEMTLQLDDEGNIKQLNNAQSSTNKDLLEDSNIKAGEQQDDKRKKRGKNKVQAVRDNFDKELQIFENVKKIEMHMTKEEINQNIKFLSNHFVFALLSNPDKEEIVKKMFYCQNTSEYVFKQGDQASSYFIIDKGQCQIIINNDAKKTLKQGDCFGELALLYGAPRSASVKTIGKCSFWAIDRNTFKKAIADVVQKEYQENRAFIDKITFFDKMTSEQKDAIANVLITQVFKKGDIIVNDGDMASSYYIIKKDQLEFIKMIKKLDCLKLVIHSVNKHFMKIKTDQRLLKLWKIILDQLLWEEI
ncbi:protein kinase domain protein [Ichthyophthirius multifiliis]|uniref:cGMP-dependent protein kinase n=1 Tax=Ichthyophthirius multifiliis TaxID=5932 RepID=G0QR60_ICHMU|nr:protein kinase domain protein [Ichthyophthirius multifiliis]EGR32300.1 protein kinase domain protein [Ichthyophthirius multifiliis]|eukprot:XP_004035786.1 protein kinase domain protein [Ichthyophthirius multifiliis]